MLEAEIDTHLGYQQHEVANKTTTKSRNGKSKNRLISEYDEQEIIRRDRQDGFQLNKQDYLFIKGKRYN